MNWIRTPPRQPFLGTTCEEAGEFERSLEAKQYPTRCPLLGGFADRGLGLFCFKRSRTRWPRWRQVRSSSTVRSSLIPGFARVLVENGFADDAGELLKTLPQQKLTSNIYWCSLAYRSGKGTFPAENTLTRVTKLNPDSFDAGFSPHGLTTMICRRRRTCSQGARFNPTTSQLHRLGLARTRSGDAGRAVTAARHLWSKPRTLTMYLLALSG
jgi:hypothetical protein